MFELDRAGSKVVATPAVEDSRQRDGGRECIVNLDKRATSNRSSVHMSPSLVDGGMNFCKVLTLSLALFVLQCLRLHPKRRDVLHNYCASLLKSRVALLIPYLVTRGCGRL